MSDVVIQTGDRSSNYKWINSEIFFYKNLKSISKNTNKVSTNRDHYSNDDKY